MTMNDTWGFKITPKWKSVEMLIRNLIDIAGKGGNYLLNVGPTAKARSRSQYRTAEGRGKMDERQRRSNLRHNRRPLAKLEWGRCTKKVAAGGTTLYLHVFDWPKDGKLLVPGLKTKSSPSVCWRQARRSRLKPPPMA
jgi:alpha-L-fucosidase